MRNYNNWVIDADVARSAGVSENPVSKNCRGFLDFVLKNGHRFSANRKLRQEWKVHQSIYSKTWLASMIARKKFIFVECDVDVDSHIKHAGVSDRIQLAALKDSHLIQVALGDGVAVASGDDRAKNAFCQISRNYKEIKGLVWVNPKSNFDEVCELYFSNKKPKESWFINPYPVE